MNLSTSALKRLPLLTALLLASQGRAWAGLSLRPESKLWLEGDSTLHPFSSTATILTVSVEPSTEAASLPVDQMVSAGRVRAFALSVPVGGLKSGEGGLDKNMYKALKQDTAPEIRFKMTGYDVTASTTDPGALSVKARGTLEIAGKENEVDLVAVGRADKGSLELLGAKELRMTEYGVQPPKLFLGALKVKDKVVVRFHLFLNAATTGGKP